MGSSRRTASLSPLVERDLKPNGRLRSRSSLDTFIIPGRTRIPSSRPELTDLQIARGLSNPGSFKVPKTTVQKMKRKPSDIAPHKLHLVDATEMPSKSCDRTRLTMPTRHLNLDDQEAPLLHQRLTSLTSEQDPRVSYDETQSINERSRITSETWSSISRRVFTDSSGGSHIPNLSGFVAEYNRLALKHEIPQFVEVSSAVERPHDRNGEDASPPKSQHHHNWLVRKIMRRPSSPISVKVKAERTPMKRKLSFSSISSRRRKDKLRDKSLVDRGRKDMLKDKSLEEISRLGGHNLLILPHEFAVDELFLPTCLSATATYLSQHGRATPGIFRIPGQLNTVNALYDYYANQYASAGNPDQIQETVGSGLLPTHISHNVHDVASVFKKIVSGLPGGLLGSLSLFASLRAVNLVFGPGFEMTEPGKMRIKARIIALAISCVTSTCRMSLICAVFGLASLIAHEAEKTAAETRGSVELTASDLMGYQALGVVLGPLLLGDLTECIELSDGNAHKMAIALPDSPKKHHRSKHSTATIKLSKNATLISHVEKAKMATKVAEMLIMTWEDVVKQFRDIGNIGIMSTPQNKVQNPHCERDMKGLSASETETAPDWLRKPPLPPLLNHAPGPIKSKERTKIPKMSWNSFRGTSFSGSPKMRRSRPRIRKETERDVSVPEMTVDSQSVDSKFVGEGAQAAAEEQKALEVLDSAEVRTSSQEGIASEVMTPTSSSRKSACLLLIMESKGPDVPSPDIWHDTPTKDAQKQIAYLTTAVGDNGVADHIASKAELTDSDEYLEVATHSCQESQASHDSRNLRHNSSKSSLQQSWNFSRIPSHTSDKPRKEHITNPSSLTEKLDDLLLTEQDKVIVRDSTGSLKTSLRKGVEHFNQCFRPEPRASLNHDDLRDKTITPDYVVIRSFPSDEEALLSETTCPSRNNRNRSSSTSPIRSLIPKPVHDLGRGRRADSRSPSPTKWSRLQGTPLSKRSSILNLLFTPDAEMSKTSPSPSIKSDKCQTSLTAVRPEIRRGCSLQPNAHNEAANLPSQPTRSLAAFSADSLLRWPPLDEEPPIAQHVSMRASTTLSTGINTRESSPQQQQHHHPFSNGGTDALARSNSVRNSWLVGEISRLNRKLEERNEELGIAKRGLEAMRELRESGTLSEGVREARREVSWWRNRAMWAERRLEGLGVRSDGGGRRGSEAVGSGSSEGC